MTKILLLFGILAVGINGHIINRASIQNLQKDVRSLQTAQEDMYMMLSLLETNLTAQISRIDGGVALGPSGISEPATDLEIRLSEVEGRIEAIKNYLMGEKEMDILLRKNSEKVLEKMEGKVKETDDVIEDLKTHVQNALQEFKVQIGDVNRTANVKINSNGAVLYGGIGSACTSSGGECLGIDNECRGGRCQCVPGLSYNLQTRSCMETCDKYGETFQSVNNKIIRGFNDETVKNITLSDCKIRCTQETSFLCRSFDYFPHWHTCYLSSSVKSEATEAGWEYNSEGIHFQRDCE